MTPEEQLRHAAEVVYQEAHRAAGLYSAKNIGQLLADLSTSPTREALLAWCSDLRLALPRECPLEPRTLVSALEREIEGDMRLAVLVLGGALVEQQRLEARDAEQADIELSGEPSREALRAVLQRWIHRGVAWGGPILGWMRDLRHRLEDGGCQ